MKDKTCERCGVAYNPDAHTQKFLPAVQPLHDTGTVAALGRTLKAAEKGGDLP